MTFRTSQVTSSFPNYQHTRQSSALTIFTQLSKSHADQIFELFFLKTTEPLKPATGLNFPSLLTVRRLSLGI